MLASSSFEPFDETVTANVEVPSEGWTAHGTALQQSTLSAMEIVASGAPRDVNSCCGDFSVDHSASARSSTRVLFRLESPTFIAVRAEILDLGDYRPLATLYTSGDVRFSLMGPGLAILHEPNQGLSVGDPLPAIAPIIIDETHLVGPGDYELDVWASYHYDFRADRTLAAGYYDVRLVATPIPEPDSLVLLVLISLFGFVGRRYVLAHFGK
jgi:hypothetical protein